MVDLSQHDVLIGGALGYLDHISTTGTHLQHLQTFDDDTTPNPLRVNGIAIAPDGEIYMALGDPLGVKDEDPQDLVYVNTVPAVLALLVARTDNTLELWTLSLGLELVDKHPGLAVDDGWTRDRYARIKVGIDQNTIYYTDRGRTIFRWDLTAGAQLPNHAQLPEDSPYIYAGFDIRPNGDIVMAVTGSGNGPRNAVAIDDTVVWVDEVNPDDETYHARNLTLPTFTDILTYPVSLSPAGTNAEITALTVWRGVAFPGFARHSVATNRVWFFRSEAL